MKSLKSDGKRSESAKARSRTRKNQRGARQMSAVQARHWTIMNTIDLDAGWDT
jgi:hypothetical protein